LLVSDGNRNDQLLLTAAAVLHDAGDGPFPHISDHLMQEMLEFRHEAAVRFAFENSPVKDSSALEEYGLSLEEVASVVKGEHRLSPFLNGSPDLDNADNVYRFIITVPRHLLGEVSYRPEEIARYLSLENKGKNMPEDLRRRWQRDWEKAYSHVWDDRLNMVGWTMLGRALRILKDELNPRFFMMTNKEAFNLIWLKLPALANGLRKKEYTILLDRKYSHLKGEAWKLTDPANLRKIEDELCKETGLKDWSLGLTVDQPLIKGKADHWRVYLVTYKRREKPKALFEDMLSDSVPIHL